MYVLDIEKKIYEQLRQLKDMGILEPGIATQKVMEQLKNIKFAELVHLTQIIYPDLED